MPNVPTTCLKLINFSRLVAIGDKLKKNCQTQTARVINFLINLIVFSIFNFPAFFFRLSAVVGTWIITISKIKVTQIDPFCLLSHTIGKHFSPISRKNELQENKMFDCLWPGFDIGDYELLFWFTVERKNLFCWLRMSLWGNCENWVQCWAEIRLPNQQTKIGWTNSWAKRFWLANSIAKVVGKNMKVCFISKSCLKWMFSGNSINNFQVW